MNVSCPHCGQAFKVGPHLAGKKAKCAKCKQPFDIPLLDAAAQESAAQDVTPAPQHIPAHVADVEQVTHPSRLTHQLNRRAVIIAAAVGGVALILFIAVGVPMLGDLFSLFASKKQPAPPAAFVPVQPHEPTVQEIRIPDFKAASSARPVEGISGSIRRYVAIRSDAEIKKNVPGSSMTLRVYLPDGNHAAKSLGCVLVAPAGTNLLEGSWLGEDDYHDEAAPYVRAGMAVVNFSLDGEMMQVSEESEMYMHHFVKAYNQFRAAHAGLVNGRNALEFVLKQMPEIDPERVYCAGHSSAGTLSLLLAAHEPRIKGCIAYAPATDVELRLKEFAEDKNFNYMFRKLDEFLRQSSPKTHVNRFTCPVFVFHAQDDSNEPFETTASFVKLLKSNKVDVTFSTTEQGGHYQSMIDEGIPNAIDWLKKISMKKQGIKQPFFCKNLSRWALAFAFTRSPC